MTFRNDLLCAAALLCLTTVPAGAVTTASENRQFSQIVARIVASYNHEALSDLSASERREWNSCVQQIFAGVPQGRKRYVLEAGNRGEQESRLEEISLDDGAAVRQAITRNCPT